MDSIDLKDEFPELSGLPVEERLKIIEKARYDTFTKVGANPRWSIVSVISMVMAFSLSISLSLLINYLFSPEDIWWIGFPIAISVFIYLRVIKLNYIKQIKPKITEIHLSKRT